jgi:hypothetical protein
MEIWLNADIASQLPAFMKQSELWDVKTNSTDFISLEMGNEVYH